MPSRLLRAFLACVCIAAAAACGSERPSITAPEDPAFAQSTATGVELLLVSGGGQTGLPSSKLPVVIAVRVLDVRGAPVAKARVNFLVKSGSVSQRQAVTDAEGYASSWWTLGPEAGPQTLRVTGKGGMLRVTANAPSAASLVRVAGDSQTAAAGTRLPKQLVVRALGGDGKPAPGVDVAWTVGGGGSVDVQETRTDEEGYARTWWTLGTAGAQTVSAVRAGAPPVVFGATLSAPGPVARVVISTDTLVIPYVGTGQLTVELFDAQGTKLPAGRVEWKSRYPIVVVDSTGRVYGRHDGISPVTATVNGVTGHAVVKVLPPEGPRVMGYQVQQGPFGSRSQFMVQIFNLVDVDGVSAVSVTMRSADRAQSVTCNMTPTFQYGPIGRGPTHAQWYCTMYLPADARHGRWSLDPVIATDSRGNRTAVTGEFLRATEAPNAVGFHVENVEYDRVPPTLDGLTLSAAATSTGWTVDARMRVSDVGAGIGYSAIELTSTGGSLNRSVHCSPESPGVMLCRMAVSRSEAAGEVVVARAGVTDRNNNHTGYSTAQLAAAGYASRIALP
jgi:hypothetical protein